MLGIVSLVCSLITLIYFAAGVGAVATYNGKTAGSWGMSLLTFGGNDGLMTLGSSGGLVTGFILAILSFVAEAIALFGLFYPKMNPHLFLISGLSALLLLVAAILLLNAKNLAVDSSGKSVFVNSVYSKSFSQISLGLGAILGGIFGILGAISDGVNALTRYLNNK